jgi:hypothetical protein
MAALSSTTALAARMPARRAAGKRLSVQAKVAGTNARVARSSKSDIIVSPSILSANFSKLGEEVRKQLPLPLAQTYPSISHVISLALVSRYSTYRRVQGKNPVTNVSSRRYRQSI